MDGTHQRILPPETTDKIVGYLHDSPAALVSSSLVQKSWTPRSQWLLYAKITLRDRQAYSSLRRLRVDPSTRPFLKWQCEHTTHLEIKDDKERLYAHAFMLTFSGFFPALTTLAYHNVRWDSSHPDPYLLNGVNALSTFGSITNLQFYGCRFRQCRNFVRTVCALHRLVDLTIVGTNIGKAPVNTVMVVPSNASMGQELRLTRLHAQHLISDGSSLAELLNWISMTPSATEKSIQILEIHPEGLTGGSSFDRPLQTLLQQLGSSITKLDIPTLSQGIGIQFGLSANDHLQSLVLRHTFREEWATAWAIIGRMLSTVTSKSLQSLELVFTIYRGTWRNVGEAFNITQSRDSWASINQVLGGEVFGRLQKADIQLDWYIEQSLRKDEVTHLQASIEEGLKNLEWHKRGILSITHNQQSWKMRS